jgi:hypothetical protein
MATVRLVGDFLARWAQESYDGFWNGVDYLWFCKWMP